MTIYRQQKGLDENDETEFPLKNELYIMQFTKQWT